LEVRDDLRKVCVDDQSAFAAVWRGEIIAYGIKLGLDLSLSGVVLNVVLSDLNDELANGAEGLHNFALLRLFNRLGLL